MRSNDHLPTAPMQASPDAEPEPPMSRTKTRVRKDSAAWDRFLEEIEAAREQLGCPEDGDCEAWFRGQSSSSYKLEPSLFRNFADPDGKDWERAWHTEKDLYWEFSARAREAHHVDDSWEILILMQHYGAPTRLLDWTEVLGVALYFAILEVRDLGSDARAKRPCPVVWVLNPYRLNELSYGENADLVAPRNLGWDAKEWDYYSYEELLVEKKIHWKWPKAIYPRQANPRIHAQRGWFTIHGDKFVPLDQIRGHERFLRKVTLDWPAVAPAKAFLQHAGLDHYSLFPDLTNLSQSLREKLGLKYRAGLA